VSLIDPAADRRAQLALVEAFQLVVDGESEVHLAIGMRGGAGTERFEIALDGPAGRFAIPEAVRGAPVECRQIGPCFVIDLPPAPTGLDEVVVSIPEIDLELRRRLVIDPVAPVEVSARARNDNATVEVAIDDRLDMALGTRGYPPRRRYAALLSPGGCGAPVGADDPRWSAPQPARFSLPVAFEEGPNPAACLTLKADRPAGAAPFISRTLAPGALVDRLDHVYAPPVEIAPMVWMVLSDLQLPSEQACALAQQRLSSAMAGAAASIATTLGSSIEALAIEPIDIAVTDGRHCQQSPDRRIDPLAVAARVDQAIDARFGREARVRALIVYATNLDAPIPDGLVDDIVRVQQSPTSARPIALMVIAPPRATVASSVTSVPFAAATEPAFEASVTAALTPIWPFQTLIHSADTRVPLVSSAETGRYRYFRTLQLSHPVEPIGARYLAAFTADASGPAYRVALEEEVLVPAKLFVRPTVSVRWEGCRDLCDRPPPGTDPDVSWISDL